MKKRCLNYTVVKSLITFLLLVHFLSASTFVKAKVAIEELDDGEILAIRMNDGEPVQNVPRSMKEEGHKILKLEDNADGTYTLYVRKVEE